MNGSNNGCTGSGATARRNPRVARLLRQLLGAEGQPIDRLELERTVGAINLPDLVMRVKRARGVDITTSYRKQMDRDGRTVEVGQYAITSEHAQAKARAVLELVGHEA
ncbi:hypothetical protein EIP75_22890 [Aquabacterium soli]|uniref:Uncharacterized protein n=1 Tax=Aquabacterium soli TaxID=2493092 RepID=A0A426UZM1_9BURK|nr:hypothetical protein [Aquabacterium soli]RRS00052.1 hypothetical protein EIP75_22890 [Aquabacterium soli]